MSVSEYEYNKLKAEADELDQALGQVLNEVLKYKESMQVYRDRSKKYERFTTTMFSLLAAGVQLFSGNPSDEKREEWVEAVIKYLNEVNGVY